jgi:hypothetical protein
MKILAQAIPGNTIAGFRLAVEAAGHTWRWWDEQREATFDVFDEFQPDVVFFMEPTRALIKCGKERDTLGVMGFKDLPFNFRVAESDFVCGWLVDQHMFCPGDTSPAYSCDIGISCSPHAIGVNLCYDTHYNIKIMCEDAWGCSQYLGIGSLEQKRDLYRSSTIVLVDNLTEAVRVAACGSVPVAVGPEFEDHEFTRQCLSAENTEEVIDYLTVKQYQRASRANLNKCLEGHTYDDALKVILEEAQ